MSSRRRGHRPALKHGNRPADSGPRPPGRGPVHTRSYLKAPQNGGESPLARWPSTAGSRAMTAPR
jgi:hypothetical protein